MTPQRKRLLFGKPKLDLRSIANLAAWYDLSDPLSYTATTAQYSGTGTVTCTLISPALAGSGTNFLSELAAGDSVYDGSGTFAGVVASVATNISATLLANATVAITGAAFKAMRAKPRVLPNDKSGNGHNLLQSTPSKQPTLSGNLLTTDGISQYVAAAFTLAQPTYYYAVLRQDLWRANNILVDGVTSDNQFEQYPTPSPTLGLYAGSDSAANIGAPVGTLVFAKWIFANALGTSGIQFNRQTFVAGTPGGKSAGGITVGSKRDQVAGGYANMSLGELAVFSALPAQDPLIQNYLINKWHVAA